MNPGGHAHMGRARAVHDEMGQREGPQHHRPGQHEWQERFARRLGQPTGQCLPGRPRPAVLTSLVLRGGLHQPGCGAYSVRVIGS